MVMNPAGVDINNRIVCDVNWVRDLTQKFAKSTGVLPPDNATRTDVDNKRENQDDDERLIKSVCPDVFTSTYPRHREYSQKKQATPQKCVVDSSKFCDAG